MRAARASVLSAVAATVAACSLWAAIDDPYKSDLTLVSEAGGPDATQDAGTREAAASDGGGRDAMAPARRLVDAGCIPYGIAAHADTVYVVDPYGSICVAHNGSATFDSFWISDASDTFTPQTNAIAATATGVFWTMSDGIRFCSTDGGGCGFFPLTNAPRDIAAGSSVVAWIDNSGVRTCATGLAGCVPVSVPGSRGAASVAVASTGAVAWTDGGTTIELDERAASQSVPVRFDIAVLAADEITGSLFWVGQGGVGYIRLDGGSGDWPVESMSKPIELFARAGIAYWSVKNGNGVIVYCHIDSDAGCDPQLIVNGAMPVPTTSDGIVATSRDVWAIVRSSTDSQLFLWRLSP